MIETIEKQLKALALGLLMLITTAPLHAGEPAPESLLQLAFHELPADQVEVLSDQAMEEIQGSMWPFIAAVATLDLSLASFFWGVYVPTVTTGGACTFCSVTYIQQH